MRGVLPPARAEAAATAAALSPAASGGRTAFRPLEQRRNVLPLRRRGCRAEGSVWLQPGVALYRGWRDSAPLQPGGVDGSVASLPFGGSGKRTGEPQAVKGRCEVLRVATRRQSTSAGRSLGSPVGCELSAGHW